MAGEVTGFFRKNGQIIPMHAAAGGAGRAAHAINKTHKAVKVARAAAAVGGGSMIAKHGLTSDKHHKIKINQTMNTLGLGISVASGAIAAATFHRGFKAMAAGTAAAHALDVAGVGANVASVAGKGHAKERAQIGAKQEARNLIVGNAVWLGGIAGTKAGREAAVGYAKAGASHLKNVLALAKKAFGAG